MHNVLDFVLESTFEVLDLMLKHFFTRCLKKYLMLQAHLKVLVLLLQAPKSVLEPNPACDLSNIRQIILASAMAIRRLVNNELVLSVKLQKGPEASYNTTGWQEHNCPIE